MKEEVEKEFPVPRNEERRIQVLQEAGLLDTMGEDCYDRYTHMAARILKTPIALISLVDSQRQWFKSKVGVAAPETHRKYAFCGHAVMEDAPPVFLVRNALNDTRFSENPLVTDDPNIRFYAGASLEVEGVRVGTLCVLDTKARCEDRFGEKEISILKDLGKVVTDMIRRRRSENITNICQTLRTNSEMLKLFQIPLNHLQETTTRISSSLSTIKSHLRRPSKIEQQEEERREETMKEIFTNLLNDVHILSKEVNRFMPISTLFTRTLVKLYSLEHFDFLTDIDERKKRSSLSASFHFGSDYICSELLFNSLTKMNPTQLQSNLHDFFNISSNLLISQSERANYVTVKWNLDEFLPTDSSTRTVSLKSSSMKSAFESSGESKNEEGGVTALVNHSSALLPDVTRVFYSYPTFIQLFVMLLYDFYDYHCVFVRISLSLQYDKNDQSPIQSGRWIVKVEKEDNSDKSRVQFPSEVSFQIFLDQFSVISKICNCYHEVIMNGDGYLISIPVYDLSDYDMDKDELGIESFFDPSVKRDEESNTFLKEESERKKPSCQLSDSFFLSPLHAMKMKWKQFTSFIKTRNKVHMMK